MYRRAGQRDEMCWRKHIEIERTFSLQRFSVPSRTTRTTAKLFILPSRTIRLYLTSVAMATLWWDNRLAAAVLTKSGSARSLTAKVPSFSASFSLSRQVLLLHLDSTIQMKNHHRMCLHLCFNFNSHCAYVYVGIIVYLY